METETREQRGLKIAATLKLRKKNGVWVVPSQSSDGTSYAVDLKGDAPKCSCPDHEVRQVKCKHIYAVEFRIRREIRPNGSTTVTQTELWRRMFHFYQFNRREFLESYHKRSNVESTFSMIKRKFGASVRSKTPVAQVNEVLCKIICHNLCVLVQSIYELGIEPTFRAESAVAHKGALKA